MRSPLYLGIAWRSVAVALAASSLPAAEPDFSRVIRPILSDNCFHCHGPDQQTREAGLRLDTKEGLFGEIEGTHTVKPGDSRASELIRRITSDDEFQQMPPPDSNRQLSATEIDLLKQWIDSGAKFEQHWAFVKPEQPKPPHINHEWAKNPIDAFILRRLEEAGLSPSNRAEKTTLIRRVTFDLTGLPPTLQEIDAFLADNSPTAYEKVVDRLFASPRYGERMAWDWLDAARYADTNGYQGDPERTMWPWRDWVIEAFNKNMPFDQFTIEQIGGDLLPSATIEQIIATGFNRNHMFNGEGGRIAEETRVENVVDRTDTTATVWLGLTFGCARCHDHKYDPISQREYYQLYAFFNNTSESGNARSGKIPPVVTYTPASTKEKLDALSQANAKLAQSIAAIEKDLQTKQLPADLKPQFEKPLKDRDDKVLAELAKFYEPSRPEYSQALNQLKRNREAERNIRKNLPQVMVMDDLSKPRKTFVLDRGAYNKPTDEVTADTPSVFHQLSREGRATRLDLARWLVDPQNPLTARVIVNRYWQTFFGKGIVKTAEDLGSQGEKPSHPELLDWLATEFVRSGWDVKAIHKLIVMSATYQQASKVNAELLEADPENRLLARGPRYRMPSWMLRDQALAASGLLVNRLGGPPVKPYQPAGIWAEATFGKKRYVQDHGENLYRRSLYIFWRRIVGPTMFFDTASRQTCTVKAVRTNTPLHALTLMNDVTYIEAARALGERVMQIPNTTPAERIANAFRRVTSRQADAEEIKILVDRWQDLKSQFEEDSKAAIQLLQVGESPRDENLNPAEHAAYTGIGMLLFNLDETLTKQ